jgi:hypothetical protein
MQWEYFSEADFIIGTQSGISHLTGIARHGAYLTNYSLIPLDMDLERLTQLHCKRITPSLSIKYFSKAKRLAMIINPWYLGVDSLERHANVRNLSPSELATGITDYLDFLRTGEWPWTLHKILGEHALSHFADCLPDACLARTTYDDISCLLAL